MFFNFIVFNLIFIFALNCKALNGSQPNFFDEEKSPKEVLNNKQGKQWDKIEQQQAKVDEIHQEAKAKNPRDEKLEEKLKKEKYKLAKMKHKFDPKKYKAPAKAQKLSKKDKLRKKQKQEKDAVKAFDSFK